MAQHTIKYDVRVHTEHYKYAVYSKMYGVYVWSHFWDHVFLDKVNGPGSN